MEKCWWLVKKKIGNFLIYLRSKREMKNCVSSGITFENGEGKSGKPSLEEVQRSLGYWQPSICTNLMSIGWGAKDFRFIILFFCPFSPFQMTRGKCLLFHALGKTNEKAGRWAKNSLLRDKKVEHLSMAITWPPFFFVPPGQPLHSGIGLAPNSMYSTLEFYHPPTYVLGRGRGIVWQLLPKNAEHQDLGYELFPCRPCLRGLLVTLFVCRYSFDKQCLN